MKRRSTIISMLFFLLVVVSCKVMHARKDVVVGDLLILEETEGISVERFRKDYSVNEFQQICERNKVYDSIRETYVFDGSETPVKFVDIVSRYVSDREFDRITLKNGFPDGNFTSGIYGEDAYIDLKTISYDDHYVSGVYEVKNLKDSVLYTTNFKNGDGFWKDYYVSNDQLKEEGQVQGNYKLGEWKYFGHDGELDSTKNYSLNDSVDVRFPYCLFNTRN